MEIRLYNKTDQKFVDCNDIGSALSALSAEGSHIAWFDFQDAHTSAFQELARELHFHPLSIEDAQQQHQRPKIEEYPGYYFIVLYEMEYDHSKREVILRELHLFLGKDFLVTVHTRAVNALGFADRLWKEWAGQVEQSAGLIAYLILDAIVDNYFPVLDALGDQIDNLEDDVFQRFDPEAIEEIFQFKKLLLYLRRFVTPLREVMNTLLRREQPLFGRDVFVYFQDVYDHLLRIADMIDSLREMIGSVMDAYLSISGNRMNVIMKRLTSISTILMSSTLIAGIYGMNFYFMPEVRWQYGYVYALLTMLAVGVTLYYFLRKIKWL